MHLATACRKVFQQQSVLYVVGCVRLDLTLMIEQ